jgi:localization factor PodJL
LQQLSHKIDSLGNSTQDAMALRQLENAVAGLRSSVSRVASNEALTSLSDEVRALAEKVDRATAGVNGDNILNAIEHRIATLADALAARNQAGQSVPDELEGAIRALADKIERVQLPRGDQVALGQLEDRIAKLMEKLDASGVRLNHLEAIEHGLAELLIHLERQRTDNAARSAPTSPDVDELSRDVADIRQAGKKSQESLEGLHGTLGQVVERLRIIETGMRSTPASVTSPTITMVPDSWASAGGAKSAAVRAGSSLAGARSRAADRVPIDPSLPADHPLEPGYGEVRRGYAGSPADRIAASESVLAEAKPPSAPAPEVRPNFIAAARRAAQAAGRDAPTKSAHSAAGEKSSSGGKLARRVGKLRAIFAGTTATLALLTALHVGRTLLDSSRSADVQPEERQAAVAEKSPADAPAAAKRADSGPTGLVASESTPPDTLLEASPQRVQAAPPADGNSPLPAAGSNTPTSAPPSPSTPAQQLTAGASASAERDVTGSIPAAIPSASLAATSAGGEPAAVPASGTTAASAPTTLPQQRSASSPADKLPATFGDRLRASAGKDDAAAQYEIAQRYAEGRGIAQNLSSAVEWFERAAKQGLAPAQFRLAGLYEKGIGVKKNLETARRLYSAAGAAGNAKALHNLAVLYAEGIDGKPDYETAAKWFRKAATYGIADSQYNLAVLYARGIGVEQNLTEAYKWFAIAAQDGDSESAKRRDELRVRLDQHSLDAATTAIQAWAPEHQPEAATEVKTPPDGWDHAPVSPLMLNPKRKPLALAPKLDLSTPPAAAQ